MTADPKDRPFGHSGQGTAGIAATGAPAVAAGLKLGFDFIGRPKELSVLVGK